MFSLALSEWINKKFPLKKACYILVGNDKDNKNDYTPHNKQHSG